MKIRFGNSSIACFIMFFWALVFPLFLLSPIIGVLLGLIGIVKKESPRTRSVIGFVLNLLPLFLYAFVVIAMVLPVNRRYNEMVAYAKENAAGIVNEATILRGEISANDVHYCDVGGTDSPCIAALGAKTVFQHNEGVIQIYVSGGFVYLGLLVDIRDPSDDTAPPKGYYPRGTRIRQITPIIWAYRGSN